MLCDWHTAQLTKHLHPTPSLPDAAFNPMAYLWAGVPGAQ